jgi:tetratricopeptide (TPR) repeat protein/uncharacterized membrane protein YgcG
MSIILQFLRYSLIVILVIGVFLLVTVNPLARTQSQLPAPNSHVNDFAAVIDPQRKERIDAILENLKLRSQIDVYVATVDSTGSQDLFEFSQQLAREWNVITRTGNRKSLLLVISVAAKNSFTQFSRGVQEDLPEGVLGELSQRMRSLLGAGKFSEALDGGVQYFVSALALKLGFSLQDIDKPVATASAQTSAESAPGETPRLSPVSSAMSQQTRPRTVKASPAPPVDTPSPAADEMPTTAQSPPPVASETPTPAQSETPASTQSETPTPVESETPATVPSESPTPAQAENPTAVSLKPPKTKTPSPKKSTKAAADSTTDSAKPTETPANENTDTPASDEDEEETVLLTLTLPLPQRAVKLKEFLDTHPNSKAGPKATEMLISTHAALGDQRLRNGDSAGGVDELMRAIADADVNISDNLFSGVIAQIPLNLYLRGEHAAAFKAAQDVEAKFGSDAKRLLTIAGFYLGIERGDEAARVAGEAVKLSPDSAEAHRILATGLHISLRLDDAAAEYSRALELDPTSKGARDSLADLSRGAGKSEKALALYGEQLKIDPKDKTALTGTVVSLLDLGRTEEADSALQAALTDDPQNLPLLTGAAYWFAAHQSYEKALDLARKAVAIEPRYTWAQIALAHAQLGLDHPLEAERAIRFARQYGKFPSLNYELANVLASMGLYDEAVDVLRESFVIRDGQIETRLAGRLPAHADNFVDLLAPERRASIYQPTPADPGNATILKNLLLFSDALNPVEGANPDEALAVTAASDLATGDDDTRPFRQVYCAIHLLRKNVALQTAFDLAEAARKDSDRAIESKVATMAVQAEEFRELRARAIASGIVPEVQEAPRSVLAKIFNGRIEDLTGWVLFMQEKYPEAIERLQRSTEILPAGTPSWRNALWHLGVALEQSNSNEEALNSYIKSYTAGEADAIHRSVIENLYRKVNGSLEGLDERIGPPIAGSTASPSATVSATSEETTAKQAEPAAPAVEASMPAATPDKTPSPDSSTEAPKTETPVPKEGIEPSSAENKPAPSSEPARSPSSEPAPVVTPTPSPGEPPVQTGPPETSDASLRAMASRVRSSIKITGQVLDANKVGVASVVVVLISPSGSVLAATTDVEGRYSFTVAASQKTYRVIPSKDGYVFKPIDRTLVALTDDQKEIDFVASVDRVP